MKSIEEAIQQKKFDHSYQKLSVNLIYTSSLMGVIHQRFLREFGLTMQQFNVLRILRGQGQQAMAVGALTERMLDQSSNASRLVEKLRTKHLLERHTCPNDRRQAEVRITPEGLDLLAQIDVRMPELKRATSSLSEKEAETLNNLLDKLRNSPAFKEL